MRKTQIKMLQEFESIQLEKYGFLCRDKENFGTGKFGWIENQIFCLKILSLSFFR